MGNFTRIIHPTDGRELQIKLGKADQCDTYKVGDRIVSLHVKDGVYASLSMGGVDDFVLIRENVVETVLPRRNMVSDLSGGGIEVAIEMTEDAWWSLISRAQAKIHIQEDPDVNFTIEYTKNGTMIAEVFMPKFDTAEMQRVLTCVINKHGGSDVYIHAMEIARGPSTEMLARNRLESIGKALIAISKSREE